MNIKCLFGIHDLVKEKRGMFMYSKNINNKLYFYGTMYKCSKCKKNKFECENYRIKGKKHIIKVKVNEIIDK